MCPARKLGDAKRSAVTLWRVGADIPARAIHPEAAVDMIVEAQLLCAAGV